MKLRSTLLISTALIALSFSACVQSMSSDVDLNEGPEDDRSYIKVYDQVSRDVKVVNNFETKYQITATYLSPDFRTAFARRFEKLFDAPQPFLEEATNKAGFFATIFSPEKDNHDLTNEQLWTIQLKAGGRAHKPILIKKLDNKDRWTPFFPAVHQWSQEYLILFDSPSVSIDEKLVNKNNLSLHFANADAKVQLTW